MIRAKTVFISRELSQHSPFRQRLQAAGWRVEGGSLLVFEPVAIGALPACDWVFFYSKRAADCFFQQMSPAKYEGVKFGAIGPGTAEKIRSYGLQPDFSGSGRPEEAAAAFAELARGERVLFPQARRSRQSVQRLLGSAVEALSLVVYDNRPRAEIELQRASVLVFTSPMNARAYLDLFRLLSGQRAVAIGEPTAEVLRAFGISPKVAAAPTEEAMAEAVLQ